jgi:hypothetical protein
MSAIALYASVGAELTRYSVDAEAATLTKCETVTLPANVQYAWPHALTSQAGAMFAGGENIVAVFAIDQRTGEPRLIQHAETHGIHCRTFHIDPAGRLLVAAHIMSLPVKDGDGVRIVPARLAVIRVGTDCKLIFARAYDVDVGDRTMFWMGMVPL